VKLPGHAQTARQAFDAGRRVRGHSARSFPSTIGDARLTNIETGMSVRLTRPPAVRLEACGIGPRPSGICFAAETGARCLTFVSPGRAARRFPCIWVGTALGESIHGLKRALNEGEGDSTKSN
jgi:hypothetical protein